MDIFISALVIFIAVQHICFLILEMFLWTSPVGFKIFGLSKENAKSSSALAANQGLYNGFLSAGLIWSLFEANVGFSNSLQIFFLSCVLLAGIYGAYTVSRKIFFVQGVPALLALVLLCLHTAKTFDLF